MFAWNAEIFLKISLYCTRYCLFIGECECSRCVFGIHETWPVLNWRVYFFPEHISKFSANDEKIWLDFKVNVMGAFNRVFLWRWPESLSRNEVAFPFKILARYIPSKSTFQGFDSCKLELCLKFITKIQLEIVDPAQHSLQESKNICICFSSLKLMNHHISNLDIIYWKKYQQLIVVCFRAL